MNCVSDINSDVLLFFSSPREGIKGRDRVTEHIGTRNVSSVRKIVEFLPHSPESDLCRPHHSHKLKG